MQVILRIYYLPGMVVSAGVVPLNKTATYGLVQEATSWQVNIEVI